MDFFLRLHIHLFHLSKNGDTVIKKKALMTVWRKLEPLYITGENVNGVVVKGLNSFGSSKSKNLPNDLAIPLPGINPTEVKTETQVLYASVRISVIHCLKGGNN